MTRICGWCNDGDAITAADGSDSTPEEGDFNVCIMCGGVSVFKGGEFVKANRENTTSLDDGTKDVIKKVRHIIKEGSERKVPRSLITVLVQQVYAQSMAK